MECPPESNGKPCEVTLRDPVVVRDLANALKRPAYEVIAELMQRNMFVSLTAEIEFPVASEICLRLGVIARRRS